MKKLLTIYIVLMICIVNFITNPSIVRAYDTDENGLIACEYSPSEGKDAYRKCLEAKRNQIKDQLEEKQNEYDEAIALARSLQNEINELQEQINILQPQIEELAQRIEELEISIAENEEKVEILKQRVLRRMQSSQQSMHFNPLLDFILGAQGFADMLRRTYGVEAITKKEEQDRNDYIDIIAQLNADKEECDAAKEELDQKMFKLESDQDYLVAAKAAQERIAVEVDKQIEALREESLAVIADISNIKYNLEELLQMDYQYGMISMVPHAVISAGMPAYPASFGGGYHIGIDYAASYGTSILAPANGIVISSVDVCEKDTGNNYGSRCGYVEGKGMAAGGNQMRMIFSVNGIMFGLIAFHMKYGSVIGEGVVTQGAVIGKVGSSGNSTGAHCHIELFYLGKGEVEDIPDYLNKGYTVGFNLGYNTSTICKYKGSAPCRLDGRYYFGKSEVDLTFALGG